MLARKAAPVYCTKKFPISCVGRMPTVISLNEFEVMKTSIGGISSDRHSGAFPVSGTTSCCTSSPFGPEKMVSLTRQNSSAIVDSILNTSVGLPKGPIETPV